MTDDHFARFKQALESGSATQAPTMEQRTQDFRVAYPELMTAVRDINEMLDQYRPGSSLIWRFLEFYDTRDQLMIELKGDNQTGRMLVVSFVYSPDRLIVTTRAFPHRAEKRIAAWTTDEQGDLVPRVVDHFTDYFSAR